MAFMERHRKLLNAYVAVEPASLEADLAPLLAAPHFLDLANKSRFFRAKMRALQAAARRSSGSNGGVSISVTRRSTFEDSFRQLKNKTAAEMRGPLNVKFRSEEGVDAGVLVRFSRHYLTVSECWQAIHVVQHAGTILVGMD
jgi:hypothetical protein